MPRKVGYCDTCNDTGEVDCYCGGDLCCCGVGTLDCPTCDGGELILGEHESPDNDESEHPANCTCEICRAWGA